MPMDIEILQTSEIEFYCPQLKLNTGVENFFPHLIKIWVTPALDKEPKKARPPKRSSLLYVN